MDNLERAREAISTLGQFTQELDRAAGEIKALKEANKLLRDDNVRLNTANGGYKTTAEKYMKLVGDETIDTDKSRAELFADVQVAEYKLRELHNRIADLNRAREEDRRSYNLLRQRVARLEEGISPELLTIQSLIDQLVEKRLGHREASDWWVLTDGEPGPEILSLQDKSDNWVLERYQDGTWDWNSESTPYAQRIGGGKAWTEVATLAWTDESHLLIIERRV